MGKITTKDADSLKKSGILSEAALKEMQDKGLVSKNKSSVKKFFKTSDGTNVQFMHYWRGIGNAKPGKKMREFIEKLKPLHDEYATTTKTKQ